MGVERYTTRATPVRRIRARGGGRLVPLSLFDEPANAGEEAGGGPAVLHVLYGQDEMLLWAERALDRGQPPVQAGGPWNGRGPAEMLPHPRCVPSPVLRERLNRRPATPSPGATSPSPPGRGLRSADVGLRLPSTAAGPLASPGAGGDPEAAGPLRWWALDTLAVPVPLAAEWLRPHAPADPQMRLGPEWAPWWEIAALVADCVRRGAVAPSMAQDSAGRLRPVWWPVWETAQRRELAAATASLPAASLPPAASAEAAVESFACAFADALVRARIAASPDARRLRSERGSRLPQSGRWLSALAAPAPRPLEGLSRIDGPVLDWMSDPLSTRRPPALVLRLDEPEQAPEDAVPASSVAAAPSSGRRPGTRARRAAESTRTGARDEPQWPLTMYLRPAADPGAFVPAADIWAGGVGARGVARHGVPDGPERLEQGLRRAAAVVPTLAEAADRGLGQVFLSTEAAWDLLTEGAARLRQMGVELLVPSFWTRPGPRPRLRLQAARAGSGLLGADALVDFRWEVALGEDAVSAEAFERLVQGRVPLCRIHGRWVALPPGGADAIAAHWRQRGAGGRASLGDALLMSLQAEASGGSAEVVRDEAMQAALRSLASDGTAALDEPPGFAGELRPYQRRGLHWLCRRAELGLGGVLADDMGLGKTVQVLAMLLQRRAAVPRAGAVLIVAPTSVVANWAAEADRFAPALRTLVHHGPARARGDSVAATLVAADLVLTSYPLLLRDAEALSAVAWDGVVLDEAQNVKNAHAKQAQAARRLRAGYRFALTGTPIENALSDLWSIFAFVAPGYLGSAEVFRRRLALRIERDGDPGARETLRRLVGPLLLRRSKEDPGVADELPPKIETTERCHLTREQAALYEAVTRQLMERVEASTGMRRRAAVLLALLRLKQVCNHPAHYTGDGRPLRGRSGKVERLVGLLAEVAAEGQSALVFTQFPSFGRRLADHLAAEVGVRVVCMDGSTPAAERVRLITEFQAGRAPIFVLSLKTGGAGLNLTAARHVFHFDRWWNPAVERQATDRAHRIGQGETVHVHRFLCAGTLEEAIDRLVARKAELAADIVEHASERWITELDDRSLRDLFVLRRTALGD